jgi:hypothetical protein
VREDDAVDVAVGPTLALWVLLVLIVVGVVWFARRR